MDKRHPSDEQPWLWERDTSIGLVTKGAAEAMRGENPRVKKCDRKNQFAGLHKFVEYPNGFEPNQIAKDQSFWNIISVTLDSKWTNL